MTTFYKINTDKTAAVGSGTVVPQGYTEYTKGSEPKELIDALALQKFKSSKPNKYSEITTAFDTATKAIIDVLPHEMATWKDQENEARSYVANNTIATPTLDAIILARGLNETVLVFATKVIANADAYRVAYLPLLGKYQVLTKQVSLATTTVEVEAIKW